MLCFSWLIKCTSCCICLPSHKPHSGRKSEMGQGQGGGGGYAAGDGGLFGSADEQGSLKTPLAIVGRLLDQSSLGHSCSFTIWSKL